jgi:hypothetical protein
MDGFLTLKFSSQEDGVRKNHWARIYGLRLGAEWPVRLAKFSPYENNLQPSEVIARGWEGGQASAGDHPR